MFKPIVQQVSQEMGIAINYVNVDYDAALAPKYKVTSIPAVIITGPDGSEWFRNSGVIQAQQLRDIFNRFR
jgi:thioredoxin-like negative regulator of GroEL